MFFRSVPDDIDEEIILPLFFLAGPGFDFRHIDRILFEDVEHVGQGARLVSRAEHQSRLVLTAWFGVFFAND